MQIIKRSELKVGDFFRDYNLAEKNVYEVVGIEQADVKKQIPARIICSVAGIEHKFFKDINDLEVVLLRHSKKSAYQGDDAPSPYDLSDPRHPAQRVARNPRGRPPY